MLNTLLTLSVGLRVISSSLVNVESIPSSSNLFFMYFEIFKVKSFSTIPFATAPLSLPPCAGIGLSQIFYTC